MYIECRYNTVRDTDRNDDADVDIDKRHTHTHGPFGVVKVKPILRLRGPEPSGTW